MDTVSIRLKNGKEKFIVTYYNYYAKGKQSYRQFGNLDDALICFYDKKHFLPKKIWDISQSKFLDYDVTPRVMNYLVDSSDSLEEFLNVFEEPLPYH